MNMDQTSLTANLEGSPKARDFIARLDEFLQTELHPLAREHRRRLAAALN